MPTGGGQAYPRPHRPPSGIRQSGQQTNDGIDNLISIENVIGSQYNDRLQGNAFANGLDGGNGVDTLIGGGGSDMLTGGVGADLFTYTSEADSTTVAFDTLADFNHDQGDRIDLRAIDADSAQADNQWFTFIGGAEFSATDATAQLRYDGATGMVYGSTDADADAEFALYVAGLPALVAADFML
jgi:Ca2+-binding RTX toxin-like protein